MKKVKDLIWIFVICMVLYLIYYLSRNNYLPNDTNPELQSVDNSMHKEEEKVSSTHKSEPVSSTHITTESVSLSMKDHLQQTEATHYKISNTLNQRQFDNLIPAKNIILRRLELEYQNIHPPINVSIAEELYQQKISSISHPLHSNFNVGDKISPDKANHIWIVASARSGSTFLGGLLNSYQGGFYIFEPIMATPNDKVSVQLELISSIYKCNFTNEYDSVTRRLLKKGSKWRQMIRENHRVWKVCFDENISHRGRLCFVPEFMSEVCPLFPIRIIKTIRFQLKNVKQLLLQKEEFPNLKIILLVRDPRAIMNSRFKMKWCKNQCRNYQLLCKNILSDIHAAHQLNKEYPGKIHVVRFEDLSMNPYYEVDAILKFLNLPRSKSIDDYIKEHTLKVRGAEKREDEIKERISNSPRLFKHPHSTFRDSDKVIFSWVYSLKKTRLEIIQNVCSQVMDELGYVRINKSDQRDLTNLNLLSKTSEDIWLKP